MGWILLLVLFWHICNKWTGIGNIAYSFVAYVCVEWIGIKWNQVKMYVIDDTYFVRMYVNNNIYFARINRLIKKDTHLNSEKSWVQSHQEKEENEFLLL